MMFKKIVQKKCKKKVLFIRTYRFVGIGGPIVSLELLYIASAIMKAFEGKYEVKILDIGIGELSLSNIEKEIKIFSPDIMLLNGLVWEADLLHNVAALSKKLSQGIFILVQGQLSTLAKEYILRDCNIDCSIIGEAELTVVELLKALEGDRNFSQIKGIIYREGNKIRSNSPRKYIEDLDKISISPSAWDLINFKKYAKYSNWNGSLKERFYVPVLTSRGCPFDCTFCCNKYVIGKKFRARSPENVFTEIKFLHEKYNVKEIHFFDAVFNYNIERAKEICRLIINSGIKFSLAFPHGLRADIMTEELIDLLKKAGTYKLVYGVETASPRLQKAIKKNLDLKKVRDIIKKTAHTGIIVGGYFMFGFPTETREEMEQTINFAVNSDLDLAAFFKVTLFEDVIKLYQSKLKSTGLDKEMSYDFQDLGYYSKKRSHAEISVLELNKMMLKAQQKFYLKPRRILQMLFKFSNKILFLKNLINAIVLILQAYIAISLQNSQPRCQDTKEVSSKKPFNPYV